MDEVKSPSKSSHVLLWITVIFVTAAIFIFAYWYMWGRFQAGTKDAYVTGNMVIVTPQVHGTISAIYVDNTQLVEEGQLLIELDSTDARIALQSAEAELGQMLRHVTKLFAQVEEYKAQIDIKKAKLKQAVQDFEHRKGLIEEGGVSTEDFEHSENSLSAAVASLIFAEYRYKAALAQVAHTTVVTHPLVKKAKESLELAWINLKRCQILAPAKGIIAKRTAQVGETVGSGFNLLAVIPLDQIWVEANFKERDLRYVRLGQPVRVTADFYGSSVIFNGNVMGIEGGTGSVFSLLPPQNATGNWIKIVQRLPVRISLPMEQITQYPLRLGLSLDVVIDTHDRLGKVLPQVMTEKRIYGSSVYGKQIEGVEEVFERIIKENVGTLLMAQEDR
ncbi:MAG: efflux RND transporter periplasmic adaptor subunit [Rhabdochlamydiaceae bacterium]|jgi:membrane fusion protein (multidrug efflux system)